MEKIPITILIGGGSKLPNLIKAARNQKSRFFISLVVSHRANSAGIELAIKNKIPAIYFKLPDYQKRIFSEKSSKSRADYMKRLGWFISQREYNPALLVFAGWDLVMDKNFFQFFKSDFGEGFAAINLHPALLPITGEKNEIKLPDGTASLIIKGEQQEVLKTVIHKKLTYFGPSVHFMRADEFDVGRVIRRDFIKIEARDTIESLRQKLMPVEDKILVESINNVISQYLTMNHEPLLKTVLVIDGGGRGAVLADKYAKSKHISRVLALPGNDLMSLEKNVKIFPHVKTTDITQIVKVCKEEKVDLIDVAQDDAVAAGLVDKLKKQKINVFGPTKKASQIEWDKAWAREFMKRIKLPIPQFRIFKSQQEGANFIRRQKDSKWFVKASGLAAGKGAIFARNNKQAQIAIGKMKNFGDAGKTFLVEQCLDGEEFSAFAIVSGKKFKIVGFAQDHKNVFDGDKGPNTGGMGCSSPPLAVNESIENQTKAIFKRTIEGLEKIGRSYTGILYLGGIIDSKGKVKIIEFNARWGDPEAQVIIPAIENDLYELTTSVIRGYFPKIKQNKSYRVIVAVASKGYPQDFRQVLGKEIKGLKKLIKSKTKIFPAGVKVKNDKFTIAGGRLFYVLGEGKDVAIARQKAYNALSLVKSDRDFLHYRHDIGWRDMKRVKPKFDK